jgi:glycosyltransferase involved in cell wall biosynthesis
VFPSLDNNFSNKAISTVKSIYYYVSDFIKILIGRLLNLRTNYTHSDLVTVIIPTFNRVEYLFSRALPSVINQTHKNLEIIVISHGSTDETNFRVQKLSLEDSRVRLITINRDKLSYPNKAEYHWFTGPVIPINTGLKAAKGKWIARIDDDDIWINTHIESSLKEALRKNLEFISSSYEVVDKEGHRRIKPEGKPPIGGVQTWLYKSYAKRIYANIDCWRKKWNKVNDTDLQDRFRKIGLRIGHVDKISAKIFPRHGETEVGLKAYMSSVKKYETFFTIESKKD